MFKKKIMIIFGTRPEAIKMAPIIKELRKRRSRFKVVICVSGQHRQMLDQVLSLFKIEPDIDLNLMEKNQSIDSFAANAIRVLTKTIREIKPDLILVQGDTTTAMVAALAGFYQRVPIGHIEAGLRTYDINNPFPEETNRRIISVLASYHFAPTQNALNALLKENIPGKSVYFTGNTVIDALRAIVKSHKKINLDFNIPERRKLILVTAHRRENFGRPLKDICRAIKIIARDNADVEIIYPVHLNPNVMNTVNGMLSGIERIRLIPPVEYHELVFLLKKAYLVLTDSGGIQEEAPAFGKPVLVMRKETERPEGIKAGVAKLVGTNTGIIVKNAEILLHNPRAYAKMSKAVNPYGDGRAARRIVKIISGIIK